MSNKAEAISYYHCTAIEDYLVSFTISQNAKLLNRNGQDWDVLCDSFTICELRQMREYLYDHHFSVAYDFNECDEISCLVYDYIVSWISDLLHYGYESEAMSVINTALVSVSVRYVWYDHLLLRETGEADIVEKAIKEKDFKTFDTIRKKYGDEFFPATASIMDSSEIIGEVDITTPQGFNMIDYSEFECG